MHTYVWEMALWEIMCLTCEEQSPEPQNLQKKKLDLAMFLQLQWFLLG